MQNIGTPQCVPPHFEYVIGYAEHSNMYQYFVFVSKFDADTNILIICVKIYVTI
jgi:hypothetical protein